MNELDSRQRIRTATEELARLILMKDDVSVPVIDRAMRLLRPARGRSGEYVGPVKSKIRQKLINQSDTQSNGGARFVSEFEKSFDALKVISPKTSPLGVNLLYSFVQIVEPLCFTLARTQDNFFNTTLLSPVNSDLLHNTPRLTKLREEGVNAADRHGLNADLLQSDAQSAHSPESVGVWVDREVEILLMRDLLFVFQGIAGKHIKYDRKAETYLLDPALGLRQSVKDVVFSLCEIGFLYAKIEAFLNRLLQGSPGANMGGTNDLFRGLVAQAFAYSIQEELHDYYRLLAVLELELTKTSAGAGAVAAPAAPAFGRQTHNTAPSHHWLIPSAKVDSVGMNMNSVASGGIEYSGLTLLRLNTWMQQPFERLYCIARLVEAISALSGGALLSRLHNYTRHGDARMASFSQSIMQSVCAPIYHMIARWILYGELQDPYNEFFIGHHSAAGKEQHNWNDVYFIRQSMLPTFIPLSLAKQIFLIGKSINFLRHCKLKLSSNPAQSLGGGAQVAGLQSRGRAPVTPTKQGTGGGVETPGTPGSAVKKIEYSFGRRLVNEVGMSRPSVAGALGYSPGTAATAAAGAGAGTDKNLFPTNSRYDLAQKPFVPTDPYLESEEAVKDTLRYSTRNNTKYYADEEEDEFDLGETVADDESDDESGGDDASQDFVDLNSKSLARKQRARTATGMSDTESQYSGTGSDDEEGVGGTSMAAAWLLRDKELENAIKNLQYSSSVVYSSSNSSDCTSAKQNSTTEFEEWIVRISSTVDRKLLHMLEAKFHLTTHLAALKNFILLGQGDFVLCLMDNMGQELKKRANQLYRHNLTGLLEGALRSSNAQYEPAFILDRIGIRLLEAQPGDTGWEVFSLDYAVDFPLSAIVHASALTKYHAMFHMLWRLKRVEWVLADSYEQLMEFKRRQGLLVLPKLLPVIHKCTMYRSSMLHVVNNLSAFLMFEVLETSWLKLQDGIRNCANNLDDLISLHDSYLDEILTKSMLTPAYEMLNMQIQQVIQTVLRFCGLEEALLFDANTSMQRKRSQKMDMESSSISAGTWGVIDESVLENPVGTVEGVPSYVITRLDDAYDDFCEQLTTLMSMLNEQGGEIGEILRFLTFRLDYNNYMSNLKTSQTVAGTGTDQTQFSAGLSDPSVSFMSSAGSMSTPAPTTGNLGQQLNAAAMIKAYGSK